MDFVELGDEVYFTALSDTTGRELWRTRGTSESTTVIDIRPGPESSNPEQLVVADGKLFFAADDGNHGQELWVTDGETTEMVMDINPGSYESSIGRIRSTQTTAMVSLGDAVFLYAEDGVHGQEVWRSDGTTPGTFLVGDFTEGPNPSTTRHFTVIEDELFFVVIQFGIRVREVWKTDDTGLNPIKIRGSNDFRIIYDRFFRDFSEIPPPVPPGGGDSLASAGR